MHVSPITTSGVYYLFGNKYGATAQANYYGAYESRLANEKNKMGNFRTDRFRF